MLTLATPPIPADADEPPETVRIEGLGWGHGRGMGQWGALGYAVDHNWTTGQILDHFYGGTSSAVRTSTELVGNGGLIRVRLKTIDDGDLIVDHTTGLLESPSIAGEHSAIRVEPVEGGFNVYTGTDCEGLWTLATEDPVAGPVAIHPVNPSTSDTYDANAAVCEPDGSVRWYRGSFEILRNEFAEVRSVNVVDLESYLEGVVPREVVPSWADLGGGRGARAIRAQAVAARSYASAEDRYPYAQTCDTASCQVYDGVAVATPGEPLVTFEFASTTGAVEATSGEVRVFDGSGLVARTEFSASTGGRTVGIGFPSVVDDGDDYIGNPVHYWAEEVRADAIEAAWPSIGDFQVVTVSERSGTGDWGGRADAVLVGGTGGSVTVTGSQFRSALAAEEACVKTTTTPGCMKSDWFRVTNFDSSPAVGMAADDSGAYWVTADDGAVFAYAGGHYWGSMSGLVLNEPMINIAARDDGLGYWLVAQDGGIFAFGGAGFFGSTGSISLNQPVVGMAPTPSGKGYWMVASDGGIFAYGDARFHGSTGGVALNQPVVAMAPTPSGNGYWLVASDGGIFAYGDARFRGSMGGVDLLAPVVAMAATPSGKGYWLVASDGGIFAFGDASFHGSPVGSTSTPVVGVAASASGNGYTVVAADGEIWRFGDA
ncbi:MAG: hypothetical protein GY745_24030 [Actinomycetia bacterium]|nr:hypothetical protein [Actinomycetes bacterium]